MKSNDYLCYKGIVNLKIINAKNKKVKFTKTIYNNGTDSLFLFLCNCLVQQYDRNYAPIALDASGEEIKNGDNITTSLAYRCLLSNQGVIKNFSINNDVYGYVARFSTIIPFSAVLSGGSLKNLQLHSSVSSQDKISSLLAYINIPGDDGIKINQGEALLVEWNLGFKNSGNNTNNENQS